VRGKVLMLLMKGVSSELGELPEQKTLTNHLKSQKSKEDL